MAETLRLQTELPASPERIYDAWLTSSQHGAFTGGEAKIDPKVGGKHSAWDGYITGTTLILEPHRRIVQSWRTTAFPEGSPDSRLEILLEEIPEGTRLTIIHTNIPDGQSDQYEAGWRDYYFTPMEEYFSA